MDFDMSFVASPYSTLLGLLSFFSFLILARKKLAIWLRGQVGVLQVVTGAASADRASQVAGLFLLGIGL